MTVEVEPTVDVADVPYLEARLQESLPARYYLADDVFNLEREHIFFREWFCAGREEQIPHAGDYLLVDIAGESIFVVRDEAGLLHAHYNVCRHRGCRLAQGPVNSEATGTSTGPTGQFGKAIRCPYHSWVYGYDGRLRGAPFLRENEHFRKEHLSLYPVGVGTWGGFIFLNLTPEDAPLLSEALARRMQIFGRFPLSELRSAHHLKYEVKANWKVIMENYNECYHCAGVHPELCQIVPVFKQKGGSAIDYAAGVRQREGTTTYTFTGVSNRSPFPGLTEDEHSLHWGNLSYPNMMTSVSSDHVAAFTLWPRSPGHTTLSCDFLFHPDEIARPDFDPSDAVAFWDLVNRQDWGICEDVQLGMASRAYTKGYYAPMEDPSLDIRRYVTDRLGTIEE